MYLSKLRIFGFKSFANKVEVNFPKDGLTAVVGPNGCGKSNIIDAIRWVMGEQRAKSLRSSKMEDVIFSGSSTRPAMNMAEVSLIIDNDKGILPGGFSQIMITRQAYRNGDSVYMLNNQPCRLKDIQNLFYDTGMGAASYSLMEAKMIDSVLSEKDDERRVLFEEAAGISKYKKQREETKRQLDRTTLDLTRVSDNLRHSKNSVALFERQAKRAEEWAAVHKEYKALELAYNWDVYKEELGKMKSIGQQMEELKHKSQSTQSALTEQETMLEEKKLSILSFEQELGKHNQIVANTNAEAMQLNSEIEKTNERIKYLRASIKRNEEDLENAVQKLQGYAKEKVELKDNIRRYESEIEGMEELVDDVHSRLLEIQEQTSEKKEISIRVSGQRMELMNELSELKHQLGQAQASNQMLSRQWEESNNSLEKIAAEEKELLENKQEFEEQLQSLEQDVEKRQSVLSGLEQNYSEAKTSLTELKEKFKSTQSEYITLQSQFKMLKGIHDSHQGMGRGVKYLLENKKDSIRGVLVDLLKVNPSYLSAVENCLGESLQTLVTENSQGKMDLLQFLKESKKGQALFFSSSDSQFKRQRPQLSSGGKWLIEEVEYDSSLGAAVEFLLGHYIVVSHLDAAKQALASLSGDFWCVCETGDLMHSSGVIKAGSAQEEKTGLLETKQKLDETEIKYQEALKLYEDEKQKLEELELKFEELSQEISSHKDALRKDEILQMEDRGKLKVIENSLLGLGNRSEQISKRLSEIKSEMENSGVNIEPLSREISNLESRKEGLDDEYERAEEEVQEFENQRKELDEDYKAKNKRVAELNAALEKATHRITFIEESEKEQTSIQMKMDLDEQEWAASMAENQAKVESLSEKIHIIHERLQEESKQRDVAKSAYDEKVLELEEYRTKIRKISEEHIQSSKAAHELEMKHEQLANHVNNIKERMFELHEIDFEDPDINIEPMDYNIHTVERDIRQKKEKLKSLGNVNVSALEDYEGEKKKLEDVQSQFDDLERARNGLEKTIKKLDRVAREQFLSTFEQIQKNFQEVFSTLFEGGQGKLTLEENVDPLDAKIEINASPSGKKMRGVTLLSGGERALTAISMLFSLYLVRVSPYCIMDEVDGPLDDANIGRFVNLLRKFSSHTQFIVVTHNKKTMEASDVLYGVTQEIKGISQLASVRLEEASLIAA